MTAPLSFGYTGYKRKAKKGREKFLLDREGQANVDRAFGIMRGGGGRGPQRAGEMEPLEAESAWDPVGIAKNAVNFAVRDYVPPPVEPDTTEPETFERGPYRGLTPEEKRSAVYHGFFNPVGRGITGITRGISAQAADIRRGKAIAPFEEALKKRIAENTDPQRAMELRYMLARTQADESPTYQRPAPRQLHQYQRYTGADSLEQGMAVTRGGPPPLGSPEWETTEATRYKPEAAAATAKERQDQQTAWGFLQFLSAMPEAKMQANIERYTNSPAWRALVTYFPNEAAALMQGQRPGGGGAGVGGADGVPPATPESWNAWAAGKPGVPPFADTDAGGREFFYNMYGGQGR